MVKVAATQVPFYFVFDGMQVFSCSALLFFKKGFKSEARGSRRIKRHQCQFRLLSKEMGCSSSSTWPLNSHAVKKINALKVLSIENCLNSHSKGGARPPFDLTLIPKKAQNVQNCSHKIEGFTQASSTQKGRSLTFFLPLFSLTTSLSVLSQPVHGV